MRCVTLKGDLKDKNTTDNKFAIKPSDAVTVSNVLGGDVAVVEVEGYSVTTVIFTLEK